MQLAHKNQQRRNVRLNPGSAVAQPKDQRQEEPAAPATQSFSWASDQLLLSSILGSGAHGTVWRATCNRARGEFAVKVANSPASVPELSDEFEVLKLLSPSPYIIQGLTLVAQDNCLGLVLEACEQSLTQWLSRSENEIAIQNATKPFLGLRYSFLQQAASAVKHMHTRKVLHLDIKPGNCLISFQQSLKLSDFGHAMMEAPRGGVVAPGSSVYTRLYRAPELHVDAKDRTE